MQNCCGGENAGKPISRTRYSMARGVAWAVFSGYGLALRVLGRFDHGYDSLGNFYRQWTRDVAGGIRKRDGINVQDKLG
jgi:hypothetical protein